MRLPFGEWLPDLAPQDNPGTVEAKNVIPTIDGYRELPALGAVSSALDSVCIGGFSVLSNTGGIFNFAGSQNSLYELSGNTWSLRLTSGSVAFEVTPSTLSLAGQAADVTLEGVGYLATPGVLKLTGATADVAGIPNVAFEASPGALQLSGAVANVVMTVTGFTLSPNDGDFWEFVKWGEKVIAVGGHKVTPQIISFGDTLFAALSGSPPNARHVAAIRNFVVFGNVRDGDIVYSQRVQWSGINDETVWTTNKAKQSDYQDLRGNHGEIQAIRGGEYGIIAMEHGIWTMEYIGPPQVFAFRETLPAVGTPAPNSVVQRGDTCFMLAQNGFVAIEGGARVAEIGSNKINKWFYDNVDGSYIQRTVGAWDRRRRVIMWIFPIEGNLNGRPNHGLIFDLETGKWSHFEDELEWVYTSLGQSLTLEDLDGISSSLDELPASLDSRQWTSNDLELTGFDDNHQSGAFDGTAMSAVIDTAEKQMSAERTMVSRLRLETDTPSVATIQSGTRASQSDAVDWSGAFSQAGDGSYPMRRESRYHRFRATITGGFTRAQGVTVEEMRQTGRR